MLPAKTLPCPRPPLPRFIPETGIPAALPGFLHAPDTPIVVHGHQQIDAAAHAGQFLLPLFDVSQPTLSHHLKKLREAGIVNRESRGLWAYYYVEPEALDELSRWLD